MGDDVLIVENPEDVSKHVPVNTSRIFISKLAETTDTSTIFIESTVKKLCPKQTDRTRNYSLMKAVLADGDRDTDDINVFFLGCYADESAILREGDIVVMTNFFVENCTNPAKSNHACQIILSDERQSRPKVCILHGHSRTAASITSRPSVVASPRKQQDPPSSSGATASAAAPVSAATSGDTSNDAMDQDGGSPRTDASVPPRDGSARSANENQSDLRASTSHQNEQRNDVTPQGQGPSVSMNYTYTKLGDLKTGQTVNVYGVVKEIVKKPYRTQGPDYMMMVRIVDASLDDQNSKLKCVLFARSLNRLPRDAKTGDILRVHRLKICEYKGELQGKFGPGFSFLVFDGSPGASLNPKLKSSPHYTISDADHSQVRELRNWWNDVLQHDAEATRARALEAVQPNEYFDLTCQVVGVCAINPTSGCLLKVWDGTTPAVPVWESDLGQGRPMTCDEQLARRVGDRLVEVAVFDDHFEKAAQFQPGQFVKLSNVHAMLHRADSAHAHSAVPTVELCVHRGTTFGRHVSVIDQSDPEVQSLKKKLEEALQASGPADESAVASPPPTNESPERRVTRQTAAKEPTTPMKETTNLELRRSARLEQKSPGKRSPQKRLSGPDAEQSPSGKRPLTAEGTSSQVPRCMVNTATVIRGHRHILPTSIQDVRNYPKVPYKFRVQARLHDYEPRAHSATEALKLYCNKCHGRWPLPESRAGPESWAGGVTADTVEDGVPQYVCPCCPSETEQGPQVLRYIFMFQLILFDDSGWLVVHLVEDEAERFFNGTRAVDALRDRRVFGDVRAQLQQLSPARGRDATRPLLELCLQSYWTPASSGDRNAPALTRNINFKVFDTMLVDN